MDDSQEVCLEKIKSWLEDDKINSFTMLVMSVPCWMGLVMLTQQALEPSPRKVSVKTMVVSLQGEILTESWV